MFFFLKHGVCTVNMYIRFRLHMHVLCGIARLVICIDPDYDITDFGYNRPFGLGQFPKVNYNEVLLCFL